MPPFRVTIALGIVLSLTFWNILRLGSGLAHYETLQNFESIPTYIIASAAAWSITGLLASIGILKKQQHGWRAGLAVSVLYFLWYWADRLFVQPDPAPNILFSIITSVSLLVVFAATMLTSKTKAYFSKETG